MQSVLITGLVRTEALFKKYQLCHVIFDLCNFLLQIEDCGGITFEVENQTQCPGRNE